MSWEAQSRRVRQTQSRLDAALSSYAQFASEVARDPMRALAPAHAVAVDMSGSAPTDPAARDAELQACLAQYASEVDALATSVQEDVSLPSSHTQMHMIQRHRELLVEFERDFFRIKTQLRQALDRQQLLGHVQQDIRYAEVLTQCIPCTARRRDAGVPERARAPGPLAHDDRRHTLVRWPADASQAYATQSEFRSQREQLSQSLTRLTHIAAQVPGLQSVITLISRRRRRDAVIVAVVLGVCMVMLLWTGVRR